MTYDDTPREDAREDRAAEARPDVGGGHSDDGLKLLVRAGLATYGGDRFLPLDPDASDVSAAAIARGLAFQGRWSGQGRRYLSIAEHSLRVAAVCRLLATENPWSGHAPDRAYVLGLLHDAHEAFLGDVPRPIKLRTRLTGICDESVSWTFAEHRLQTSILEAFRIEPPTVAEVEVVGLADNLLLALEARWLGIDPRRSLFQLPTAAEISRVVNGRVEPGADVLLAEAVAVAASAHGYVGDPDVDVCAFARALLDEIEPFAIEPIGQLGDTLLDILDS